jgi:hypothetical protein
MQDGPRRSPTRHESLESHVRGKLASVVRRGAAKKGPSRSHLAGGLPDSEVAGGWDSLRLLTMS